VSCHTPDTSLIRSVGAIEIPGSDLSSNCRWWHLQCCQLQIIAACSNFSMLQCYNGAIAAIW